MVTEYGKDMDKNNQVKKLESISVGENPLFKKKYDTIVKSTKEVIFQNDIRLSDDNESIFIGGSVIELKMIGVIILEYTRLIESESTEEVGRYQIHNTCIRYKTNYYDRIKLEKEAYEKLQFIWDLYKKRTEHKKQIDKANFEHHLVKVKTLNKSLLEVNKQYKKIIWFLLFIILVLSFLPNLKADDQISKSTQVEKFQYTFVYEVNIDKCQPLEAYNTQNKFTYWDIKNSKLVAEFPHRPGELIFISTNGDMYVFTDTEDRCLKFQKRFIDEMNKQNEDEENRYQEVE